MAQEVTQSTDFERGSLQKIEKDTSFSLGQYGATYLEAGASTSGSFGAIQALEAAVLDLSATNWFGTDGSVASNTSAIPVPAGVTIFGNFDGFEVVSGKVLAYRNA
jgi:hypothetical protein